MYGWKHSFIWEGNGIAKTVKKNKTVGGITSGTSKGTDMQQPDRVWPSDF